jgi:16S rRNA (adenine1518-N6/adenine1519-N6)-dimethyltransferase
MPIYRPSELMSFLESLGISPKKGLSQNFLIDGNVLKKISQLGEVAAGDTVIEIGPGPGVLTEHLLELGAHVIACELDHVYAKELPRLLKNAKKGASLEVVEGDFLAFDLEGYLKKILPPGKKAKVIANIPYHLTTPIIEKIIETSAFIERACLMVQDEVAKRCVGAPPSQDFSSFSVFLQYHAKVRYGFLVPKKCFYPVPGVESAVIRFDLEKQIEASDEKAFFTLVRRAFTQRRKMVRASLRDLYTTGQLETSLKAIGKGEHTRPQELSIKEWVAFFEHLKQNNSIAK